MQIPGLTYTRFPIHPHRRRDELFSSWFVHTAHANHLKAQTFGTLVFGRRAFVWTRDIDRCATPAQVERLSRVTGCAVDELNEGLLKSYEGKLFKKLNSNTTRWILPSVFYLHRRVAYGMQFCPLCLFFDAEPYFRKHWRLAFATICDVHGSMLHDRCPDCGAPVVFFRNDTGDVSDYRLGDIVSCWRCGSDLRRAPVYGASGPDGKTIAALRSLVTFHDLGWWFQGDRTIQYSMLYFETLHRLVTLLATPYGERLRIEIERRTGWKIGATIARQRGEFEHKPLPMRHRLLMAALWLLDDWPDRFVDVAKQAGAIQSEINDGVSFPYWFESVIRANLGGGRYSLTAEEVAAAVSYLRDRNRNISGTALAALLGRKDAEVVRPFIKEQRLRPFSANEVEWLCKTFDAEHANSPTTCRFRLIWQRDRAILRFWQQTGYPYEQIAKLGLSDVGEMPEVASVILTDYVRTVRPLMSGEHSGDALFIKWRGGYLTTKSWTCRVRLYRHALAEMNKKEDES